jgi:glycosyltransferase involved in cell wall biosynthesis
MVDFYVREYGRKLEMIAYGAYIENSEEPSVISQYGVAPMQYYLIASRLVPENNADLIIEAFKRVQTDRKLLIIGSTNYDSPFHQKIHNSGDPRVNFTGWINDQRMIKELHCNCYAYIHGHSVGGTNPALLKALGYSNMVLALNTPFNSEVLVNDKYGILFEKGVENLREKIAFIEENPEAAMAYRLKAPERIRTAYTWEKITAQYVDLLTQVLDGRSDSRQRMRMLQFGLLVALIAFLLLAFFFGQ